MDEIVDHMANAVAALETMDVLDEPAPAPVAEEVVAEEVQEEAQEVESTEESQVVEEEAPAPVVEAAAVQEKTLRQVKHLQKRLKVEGDRAKQAEEQLKAISEKGIDKAQALAAAAFGPQRDFNKVFELLGFKPEDVVEAYRNHIPNADQVQAKLRQDREEASAKALAAERADLTKKSLSMQATGIVNKYAENLPVLAALGPKGVDQVVEKVRELFTNSDPILAGVRDFESAVKKVLPLVERENRKELKPLVEAFAKLEAAKAAKEKPAEAPKTAKKPDEKKPVAPAKEAPKAKATLKGSPGSPSTKVSRPMTEEERLNKALDAFLQF